MKFDLWKYLSGMALLVLGATAYYFHHEPLGIFWICLSALSIHDSTASDK